MWPWEPFSCFGHENGSAKLNNENVALLRPLFLYKMSQIIKEIGLKISKSSFPHPWEQSPLIGLISAQILHLYAV